MNHPIAGNIRLIMTKAVLWCLVGIAAVIAVVRYARGLGETTNLTDLTPWGMWIGFDVLSGVALAAGGFVIAGTVYIFGRHRYHGIVRPAVLTAFLGYVGVIVGLIVDLGRPYNLYQIFMHQNLHSPLFEVATCVVLYTTVLALEFAPVALEGFRRMQGIVKILRKATIPLVITGICLSTLHQSSLGTLFLLTSERLHPLWYSPLQTPMFFISAIGLGLGMVIIEGLSTSWVYRRKPEWPQFAGLSKAAAVVLSLYLALRLIDLGVRGQLGHAFDGSWFASLFWIELAMSAIIPILLFSLPNLRGQNWATGWGALLVVSGFVLHRADVGGISHIAVTGEIYVPALTELFVSTGIVAGLAIVFLFFVEKLQVWEEPPEAADPHAAPAFDPVGRQFIGGPWLGGGQRAVLALIVGAVIGLAMVEAQVASRTLLQENPVDAPRNVMMTSTPNTDGPGHAYHVASWNSDAAPADDGLERALMIDSGGAGRFVLFEHEAHAERLGGREACARCHHRNVPLDLATSCTHCHVDMFEAHDTFSHSAHEAALGGREGCVKCHEDPEAPKTRAGAKACDDCHAPAIAGGTLIRDTMDLPMGVAPGYREAMHGLCLGCHEEQPAVTLADGREEPYMKRCATCHRHEFGDEAEMLRRNRVLDGSAPARVAAASEGSAH